MLFELPYEGQRHLVDDRAAIQAKVNEAPHVLPLAGKDHRYEETGRQR